MLRSVKYHRCKQCPYITSNTSKFIEHMQQHNLSRPPPLKPFAYSSAAQKSHYIDERASSRFGQSACAPRHPAPQVHQQQLPWQIMLKNEVQRWQGERSYPTQYQPVPVNPSSWPYGRSQQPAPTHSSYTPVYLQQASNSSRLSMHSRSQPSHLQPSYSQPHQQYHPAYVGVNKERRPAYKPVYCEKEALATMPANRMQRPEKTPQLKTPSGSWQPQNYQHMTSGHMRRVIEVKCSENDDERTSSGRKVAEKTKELNMDRSEPHMQSDKIRDSNIDNDDVQYENVTYGNEKTKDANDTSTKKDADNLTQKLHESKQFYMLVLNGKKTEVSSSEERLEVSESDESSVKSEVESKPVSPPPPPPPPPTSEDRDEIETLKLEEPPVLLDTDISKNKHYKSLSVADKKIAKQYLVTSTTDKKVKFHCKKCPSHHQSLPHMVKHAQGHSVKNAPYECQKCGWASTSIHTFRNHKLKHKSSKTYHPGNYGEVVRPCVVQLTTLTLSDIKDLVRDVKAIRRFELLVKKHAEQEREKLKSIQIHATEEELLEEKFPIDYHYQWKLLECVPPLDSYDFRCIISKCRQKIMPQTIEAVLCHLQHHSLNYFVLVSCELCSYKADTEDGLKYHMGVAHADTPSRTCVHCPYKSPSTRLLTEHTRHHQESHEGQYRCIYCTYYGKDTKEIEEHRKVHRSRGRKKLMFYVKRNECNAPVEGSLRERMDKLCCKRCPYHSFDAAELEKHSKHHGQTDLRYKCKVCDFYSDVNEDINAHLPLHFTPQPLTLLPDGSSLKLHKHKDCKLHPVGRCEQKFHVISQSDLQPKVRQMALEDSLLVCDYCGRAYDERDSMDYLRHEARHLYSDGDIEKYCPFLKTEK